MNNSMKILFTSVGRRVELMQAFHSAADKLKMELSIFGTDITETAPALYYCDKSIQICRIDNLEYIPQLLNICRKNKINAVIPTIDTDLLLLSQNKQKFENVGTKVYIGAPDKIAICRDKRLTGEFFGSCGLKAPKAYDNISKYQGGYPAFIKPLDGSSSIDAYMVKNEEELGTYSLKIKDYIIQPYIDGTEYTIDIFCNYNGMPVYITPRTRMAVRSGEVLKTKICQDEKMILEMQKLIKKFKPCGQITVQLIKDKQTEENYYIEINPRFGGGAPLAIKAGADSAQALLLDLLGQELPYQSYAALDSAIYSRFDQSICVQEGTRKCR